MPGSTSMGLIIAVIPRTPRKLKMLEPRMLPMAILVDPFESATKETVSSGSEVPITTNVKPIKALFEGQGFTQDFINFQKEFNIYKTRIDISETVHNKPADYFDQFDKTIPKYEYFLTEELKEKIYNFYKKDFMLFKYNKN